MNKTLIQGKISSFFNTLKIKIMIIRAKISSYFPFYNIWKSIISFFSLFLIVGILALATYFIKFRQNTSPVEAAGVNLKLTSVNTTVNKGDEFFVDVFINTKGLSVTGADLKINYDNNILEAISIESRGYLPVSMIPGQISNKLEGDAMESTGDFVDVLNIGFASISMVCDPTKPKNGTGILATIKFKAKRQGVTTEISFDEGSTTIAAIEQTTDVLNKPTTPLTITIASKETTTPSSTSISTPTGTPTIIPTAVPTEKPTTPTGTPTTPQPKVSCYPMSKTYNPAASLNCTPTGKTSGSCCSSGEWSEILVGQNGDPYEFFKGRIGTDCKEYVEYACPIQ